MDKAEKVLSEEEYAEARRNHALDLAFQGYAMEFQQAKRQISAAEIVANAKVFEYYLGNMEEVQS